MSRVEAEKKINSVAALDDGLVPDETLFGWIRDAFASPSIRDAFLRAHEAHQSTAISDGERERIGSLLRSSLTILARSHDGNMTRIAEATGLSRPSVYAVWAHVFHPA